MVASRFGVCMKDQLIPLRAYQHVQHEELDKAKKAGKTRVVVSSPTGSGKTVFAGAVTNEYNTPVTIMQVHRNELANQSIRKMHDMNPGKSIGLVKAEHDDLDSDILIVSAQTLAQSKRLKRLTDSLRGRGEILMWSDECHHDCAASRIRIIEAINPNFLVGLTATAFRSDRKPLSKIYKDGIISHTSPLDLMEQGWLVWPKGMRVDIDADLDKINKKVGDLPDGELSKLMDTPHINRIIVNTWIKEVDGKGRKRTAAFCVTKEHARHLCEEFNDHGIEAAYIVDDTPTKEREVIYDRFRAGEIKVLIGCMVFTEGWDEPIVDTILMCRPTKSLSLYIQVVGRGLRPYPDKSDCLIVDFVGNSTKHRLITFPAWAGVETLGEESLDNGVTALGESIRESGLAINLRDIVDTLRGAKTRNISDFDVLNGSRFSWSVIDGDWMINTGDSYITVVKSGDGYVPFKIWSELSTENSRQPKKTWQVKPLFSRSLAMDMAIGVAETSIKNSPLTNRSAGWRQRTEEPTEPQLRYANILGINIPVGATKSMVADLIDRETFIRTKQTVSSKLVV